MKFTIKLPPFLTAMLACFLTGSAHPVQQLVTIDFDPVPGEETAQIFADFYNTPPALVEQARQYTQPDQK